MHPRILDLVETHPWRELELFKATWNTYICSKDRLRVENNSRLVALSVCQCSILKKNAIPKSPYHRIRHPSFQHLKYLPSREGFASPHRLYTDIPTRFSQRMALRRTTGILRRNGCRLKQRYR